MCSTWISEHVYDYVSEAKNKDDGLVPKLAVFIVPYVCYYSGKIQQVCLECCLLNCKEEFRHKIGIAQIRFILLSRADENIYQN